MQSLHSSALGTELPWPLRLTGQVTALSRRQCSVQIRQRSPHIHVAQLAERRPDMTEVTGSIPVVNTSPSKGYIAG